MTNLNNKVILIISPQSWGKMFVSKHHYALDLARRGNTVYFLNPPAGKDADFPGKIDIRPSGIQEGLYLINHRLSFSYNIKFHFIGLFHALMRPHIRSILGKIGRPVDIIWSFDLGNLYPFGLFPARALKIFHPVDEPLNKTAINSARGSQVIFSLTKEILEKYKGFPVEKHFVNHGLAKSFLLPVDINRPTGNPIRVGLSGNFLRGDIDREVLLRIIKENSQVIFECWGSYALSQSNIAGNDDEPTRLFIQQLKEQPNVILHGAVSSDLLPAAMQPMDAFLICYDVKKDQSKGTNYHKIMEYLSTGKVIISNNVTTYRDRPELVQMVQERDHNQNLPVLFQKIIHDLSYYNTPALQDHRIKFSLDNTYNVQIDRIEKLLNP